MYKLKYDQANLTQMKPSLPQPVRVLYAFGKSVEFHYGQVGFRKNLSQAWVDSETGHKSIVFEFEDGKIEYMPYDQPFALAKDPEFLLQTQIELLTSQIKAQLAKRKISKRFLANHLHTSDNQVQRLLNPQILNKKLAQLYSIASLLGLEFEIKLKSA